MLQQKDNISNVNPQDINGKSYKYFIAGDTTTPEAHMDKLTFDNILFKCEKSFLS